MYSSVFEAEEKLAKLKQCNKNFLEKFPSDVSNVIQTYCSHSPFVIESPVYDGHDFLTVLDKLIAINNGLIMWTDKENIDYENMSSLESCKQRIKALQLQIKEETHELTNLTLSKYHLYDEIAVCESKIEELSNKIMNLQDKLEHQEEHLALIIEARQRIDSLTL